MSDATPTQADRDSAASFARTAWHLFWPNNYDRAMADANDIQNGRCDNWRLVQTLTKHAEQARQEERERCAAIAEQIESVGLSKNLGSVIVREIIEAIRSE